MKRFFIIPIATLAIVFFLLGCHQSDKNSPTQLVVHSENISENSKSIPNQPVNHEDTKVKDEILRDTITKTFKNNLKITATLNSYSELKLHFFRKKKNNWQLVQIEDSLFGQFIHTDNIALKDFNQDGKEDLKITYGTGTRGANELSYVFLQDAQGQFYHLNGSEDIPNIDFDEKRQVITGIYFTGSITFIDFKIENDVLQKLSGMHVETNEEWTHRTYFDYENDKRVNERRDSTKDNGRGAYSRE